MNLRFALATLICVLCIAGPGRAITLASVDATLADARKAIEQRDYLRAKADYELLLKEAPEHPALQRGLARSLAGLGRKREAQNAFEAIIDEGFGGGIADDPAFRALDGLPGQARLAARAKAQTAPLAPAQAVFQIADPRFVAEGMAFDPSTRRLFVSSTYLRKVIARAPDGSVVDFVPSGDHGLLQVLGMKADVARGRLVVLTGADDPKYVGARPEEHNRTGVFAYELATGRFLSATWLGEAGDHLFNDLVIAPDGTIYITDSTAGRLYRFAAGKLEALTPEGGLLYPNGVDLDSSRGLLYVADVRGVFVLDLSTRQLSRVAVGRGASAVSIDGLYFHRGWLVGVQNDVSPDRVAAFRLSADGRSIVSSKVLERADPRLDGPTEGVVVGDDLYFVANSNARFVDDTATVAADAAHHPVSVLKLRLPTRKQRRAR
jgi:sugar lactone lactonase YvrE